MTVSPQSHAPPQLHYGVQIVCNMLNICKWFSSSVVSRWRQTAIPNEWRSPKPGSQWFGPGTKPFTIKVHIPSWEFFLQWDPEQNTLKANIVNRRHSRDKAPRFDMHQHHDPFPWGILIQLPEAAQILALLVLQPLGISHPVAILSVFQLLGITWSMTPALSPILLLKTSKLGLAI